MNVLFIPFPRILNPWYQDFLTALNGEAEVSPIDLEIPIDEQMRGVDVVVEVGGAVGTREMIDAAHDARVQLWQILGTGLDHVDVPYFLERGVALANTPGQYSAVALAEHALFLMLCSTRRLRESDANVRAGLFGAPFSDELYGRTLCIVGLGASGRELARRASAFGMEVTAAHYADISPEILAELGVDTFGKLSDLDTMLSGADFVSLHVPLLPSTRELIDRRRLGLMRSDAILINVARGGLVDEAALVEALEEGRIKGAGLDVFVREPLPRDHALLQMDNVIVTPHTAGVTDGTSRRRGMAGAENVRRIKRGEEPLHLVTTVDA